MTPMTPVRMMFSSRDGWPEFAGRHPAPFLTFVRVVLPASLLAAAMVLYAGYANGAQYAPGASMTRWLEVSVLFLLACWGCVHVMALYIQRTVHVEGQPGYADCYRLAAVAPLPIWLSSLFLLQPWLALTGIASVLGLMASGGLIFHGLDAMFEHDDSVRTEELAYSVFSAGALLWALLSAFIVLMLL